MKSYLKYTIVVFIIVFSSFVLSTNHIPPTENNEIVAVEKKLEIPVTLENSVEFYPKSVTKVVSKKLDSLMKRINKRHDFHGSLLVAHKGKIIYNNHIGYADFRKKEYISDSSIFQLASVSKQFTAAAIMLLKEREQLKLTDSVTAYFPDFPYKDVTITHLLNHTAGLPKYFWVAEHKWEHEKAPTNEEMMTLMAETNVERFFRPGRNFDYSNTAYFVLASIVEKVSKKPFAEFMESEIFAPLNMNDSFVYSFENTPEKEGQLTGYRLYRGWRHIPIGGTVNDAITGDKNVYSTSKDLYKWIVGLNSGKLLSQTSLDLMYSKGKTVYNREVPYGFGFRLGTSKDKDPIIYHHGKWNGFSTSITQYPEDELVVIVLEHTSYNAMTNLNRKIKKLVSTHFNIS